MRSRSRRFPFLESKHDGGDWSITSGFGHRTHPITGAHGKFHSGIDIGTYSGTKVYAPVDGLITDNRLANDSRASLSKGGGYMVYLRRDNGDRIRFLHLLGLSSYVKVGQRVRRGDLICNTGSSGGSTGAHLHLDVQVAGEWVDPEEYLKMVGMYNR